MSSFKDKYEVNNSTQWKGDHKDNKCVMANVRKSLIEHGLQLTGFEQTSDSINSLLGQFNVLPV